MTYSLTHERGETAFADDILIVDPGTDPWPVFQQRFPVGGDGGQIVFRRGETYVLPRGFWLQNGKTRGNLVFRAEDGVGPKPVITGPMGLAAVKTMTDDVVAFHALDVRDTTGLVAYSDTGLILVVECDGDALPQGMVFGSGRKDSTFVNRVEVYGGSVFRSGGGNTRHNIYAHGDRVVVQGLVSGASRRSHALKIVAPSYSVWGCVLSTGLAGVLPDVAEPFLGTTLLDIAAAASGEIVGNRFEVAYFSNAVRPSGFGPTTAHAIDLRRRKDWSGGRTPNPMMAMTTAGPSIANPEILDPAFWQAIADAGMDDPANPGLFVHRVTGNVMHNLRTEGPVPISVHSHGTAYMWDDGESFTKLPPEPVNQVGFERTLVVLDGNDFGERIGAPAASAPAGFPPTRFVDAGLAAPGEPGPEPEPAPAPVEPVPTLDRRVAALEAKLAALGEALRTP
jgi:hypothetical protein